MILSFLKIKYGNQGCDLAVDNLFFGLEKLREIVVIV